MRKLESKIIIIQLIALLLVGNLYIDSQAENVYEYGCYTYTVVNVGYSNYIATITKCSVDADAEYVSVPSTLRSNGITATVYTVSENMLANHSKLKKVTLPSTIRSIANGAFQNCSSLISINLENVSYIGSRAFEGCSRLSKIELGSGITSISESAFKGCSSLTDITIPASVTTVEASAFEGCTNLKRIHFKGDAPTSISETAFKGCSSDLKIIYNEDSEGWSDEILSDYNKEVWGKYLDCVDAGLSRNYFSIIEDFAAPTVTVRNYMGEKLVKDVDYIVEYDEDTSTQGTHTVTITGINPYSFTKELQYTVFPQGGVCGTNAYYYKEDGGDTLYIFGIGNLTDAGETQPNYVYLANGQAPWLSGVETVIIDEGITNVGIKAFSSYYDLSGTDFFPDLKTIYLPTSLMWIKNNALTHQFDDVYFGNNDTIIENAYAIISKRIHGTCNSTAFDYASARDNTDFVEECDLHLLSKVDSVKASTESSGNIEYWHCLTCEKCYSDIEGKTEITQSDVGIAKIDTIELDTTVYKYDNTAKKPTATIKDTNSNTLIDGKDYVITYSNNTNAGTATATITFQGNYTGVVEKTFTINALDVSVKLLQTSFKYKGSAIEPDFELLTSAGLEPEEGTDYTVEYSDNNAPGTGYVTLTFKGNYTGTITKSFEIEKTYMLSGNIVTSSAASGYSVELLDENDNSLEAGMASNTYSLKYVDAGKYTARVSAAGDYVSRDYTLNVADDITQNFELFMLGDANCDNIRDAADITRIARHLARLSVEKDDYTLKLFNADRSEDGKITAADATKLARFAAGIVPAL